MEAPSNKLYSFDDNVINACYFDYRKFYIQTPPYSFFKEFYKEVSSSISASCNPSEILQSGHFFHEFSHYMHLIGTPVCIFDNLLSIISQIRISRYVKSLASSNINKICLPFYKYINENPEFLKSDYLLFRGVTSYLYCFYDQSNMPGLENTKRMKFLDNYSANLFRYTQATLQKSFIAFRVTFEVEGKITKKLIPIGLYSILEGFASLIQEHLLLRYLPAEKIYRNVDDIVQDGKRIPYYVLRYYAHQKLNGLKKGDFGAIFAGALYLSLMNLNPIFYKNTFSPIDMKEFEEQTVEFLTQLSHPSQTFFNAFFTLKDIVEEQGGVAPGEKGVIDLINKACERMDMPPLDSIYEVFSNFLRKMLNEFYSLEFKEFYFAKHYFELGLEVMKVAKENPYDFMVFPTGVAEKVGEKITPFAIKGIYSTKASPEKIRWYLFFNIMEQFLHKKRIFCHDKYVSGTNKHCRNDKECTVDKIDYPYSKCEKTFLDLLKDFLGDFSKLVPS